MLLNIQNHFCTLHSVQETIPILRYYIIFNRSFFLTISTNDVIFMNQLKDVNFGVLVVFSFLYRKFQLCHIYPSFLGPCLHPKESNSRAGNCKTGVHQSYVWCPQRPENSVTKARGIICKGFEFMSSWYY